MSPHLRGGLIWAGLGLALVLPLAISLTSPLLAWRDPVYILAGAAGVVALGLLLLQPLLAAGVLPGLGAPRGRALHRWVGAGLVLALVVHVGGLWITSPPDVVDALLLRSPTPFSAWGVLAMWALFASATLALLRRRLRLGPVLWRRLHLSLALVTLGGTALHALLIEGTMGPVSKALAVAATLVLGGWIVGARLLRRA